MIDAARRDALRREAWPVSAKQSVLWGCDRMTVPGTASRRFARLGSALHCPAKRSFFDGEVQDAGARLCSAWRCSAVLSKAKLLWGRIRDEQGIASRPDAGRGGARLRTAMLGAAKQSVCVWGNRDEQCTAGRRKAWRSKAPRSRAKQSVLWMGRLRNDGASPRGAGPCRASRGAAQQSKVFLGKGTE